MPQNEHIELHRRRYGYRLDHRRATAEAQGSARSTRMRRKQRRLRGLKAKMLTKKRYSEKVQMNEDPSRCTRRSRRSSGAPKPPPREPCPSTVPGQGEPSRVPKVLSNIGSSRTRKEKAGKWDVPVPKVRGVGDSRGLPGSSKTGKRKKKAWKRMVTKVTFVGEGFTRKPPKFERFIRPMALRFKKAHVTHPELKATFYLPIIGVKKNPSSPLYSQLGVITLGTVLEVNVSELGLVTQGGKVVWGKYAQVTNNPENDGCINAVLLV
uniref:Ribosome biogenesis protein NSA2 homolog n=1 Tax=Ixodes ricinus TaxID=34613 RepID=A0A090X9W1_IXORI